MQLSVGGVPSHDHSPRVIMAASSGAGVTLVEGFVLLFDVGAHTTDKGSSGRNSISKHYSF